MMNDDSLPSVIDPHTPIFSISVAAALADMHPQTLRTYDRLELVVPHRTKGGGRRYSPDDVCRLRLIQRLSQDEGINLEGIRHILALRTQLEAAQERIDELTELLHSVMRDQQESRRVFTAGSSGFVAHGRIRRNPLALPPR